MCKRSSWKHQRKKQDRVLQLCRDKDLKLEKLTHFVLDECDKCLEKLDMRQDVQKIFMETPKKKQVMMFSATMTKETREVCKKFMQNPHEISVDEDSKLTLHGLLQYYLKLSEKEKNRKLNDLLDALEFNQVVIFVKSVQRATALDKLLVECSFPSIAINYDMPEEGDTYLHRVGRAGRFGTKGLAISFVSTEEDEAVLKQVQERFEVNVDAMPSQID